MVDLVERGLIRILDLTFVRKEANGTVGGLEVADLDGDGQLDLSVLEGTSPRLLGEDDIQEASGAMEPDSSAGILFSENVWAAPLAREIGLSGGRLVASGRIPVEALISALDGQLGRLLAVVRRTA